jgi:hypothetical protein
MPGHSWPKAVPLEALHGVDSGGETGSQQQRADLSQSWPQASVFYRGSWLACTFPCRRFADILTDACARLGADVVRYSFIVVDLHHLLLAGLPAHLCKNALLDLILAI